MNKFFMCVEKMKVWLLNWLTVWDTSVDYGLLATEVSSGVCRTTQDVLHIIIWTFYKQMCQELDMDLGLDLGHVYGYDTLIVVPWGHVAWKLDHNSNY